MKILRGRLQLKKIHKKAANVCIKGISESPYYTTGFESKRKLGLNFIIVFFYFSTIQLMSSTQLSKIQSLLQEIVHSYDLVGPINSNAKLNAGSTSRIEEQPHQHLRKLIRTKEFKETLFSLGLENRKRRPEWKDYEYRRQENRFLPPIRSSPNPPQIDLNNFEQFPPLEA